MRGLGKHYFKACLQIFLLIGMTFSFCYFVKESDETIEINENEEEGFLLSVYKILVNNLIGTKGFVSAADIYTCKETKNRVYCSSYSDSARCTSECNGPCVNGGKELIPECKLGYCSNGRECASNVIKVVCRDSWSETKPAECERGCCIIAGYPMFTTQVECQRKADSYGFVLSGSGNAIFNSGIKKEDECISKVFDDKNEGACVMNIGGIQNCKRTTEDLCKGSGKVFYKGSLCSAMLPDVCDDKKTVNCAEGFNEVYWFDSCGNRENIYDATKSDDKETSIISKENSCPLGDSSRPLLNQGTCGNCNYILGSKCGQASGILSGANVACKNLNCNVNGALKKHGDSWCVYQSDIGTEKGVGGANFLRSVDTPGSTHFVQKCINGEIITEPCADYRNEICVQGSETFTNGASLTQARCVPNRWQECLAYNTEGVDENGRIDEDKIDEIKRSIAEKCVKNPYCFLKEVDLVEDEENDNFRFAICAPKYPAGLETRENSEGAENTCSLASQKCTVLMVKEFSWAPKSNAKCLESGFAEQMNDLCMSMGDCGASVNYVGGEGEGGYEINIDENPLDKKAPKFGNNYIAGLKDYDKAVSGKSADAEKVSEFLDKYAGYNFGSPLGLEEDNSGSSMALPAITGMGGIAMLWGMKSTAFLNIAKAMRLAYPSPGAAPTVLSPVFSGVFAGIAGALIGASVVALLIKFLMPGMDPYLAGAFVAAGAGAGGLISAGLTSNAGWAVAALPFAVYAAIAIVVIIVFMKFVLNWGATKKVNVRFSCMPWQPKTGTSSCGKCGEVDSGGGSVGVSKLPCTKYACESLGQNCQLVNAESESAECVEMTNDNTPLQIRINETSLSQGLTKNDLPNGAKLSQNGRCIKSMSKINYGIVVNKHAQCRYGARPGMNFEDMNLFGMKGFDIVENLFLTSHNRFEQPIFNYAGISGQTEDRTIYVKCKDVFGGVNTADFAINYCVEAGDDLNPPIIKKADERNKIPRDANQFFVKLLVDEPAQCRWANSDSGYTEMTNSLTCGEDIADRNAQGYWECTSNLPTPADTNNYFVRCRDHPELVGTDKESKRNTNSESYQFSLVKSQTSLKIDSISPSGTLTFGANKVFVKLNVKTSGGENNGVADCSWKYVFPGNVISEFSYFGKTRSTEHEHAFNTLNSGQHNFEIKCEDSVGNNATGNANFEIKIESGKVFITRVYEDFINNLVIISSKPGSCFIDYSACPIINSKGIEMSGSGSLIHTAVYARNNYTYINCNDIYGNSGGESECIKIKGGIAF